MTKEYDLRRKCANIIFPTFVFICGLFLQLFAAHVIVTFCIANDLGIWYVCLIAYLADFSYRQLKKKNIKLIRTKEYKMDVEKIDQEEVTTEEKPVTMEVGEMVDNYESQLDHLENMILGFVALLILIPHVIVVLGCYVTTVIYIINNITSTWAVMFSIMGLTYVHFIAVVNCCRVNIQKKNEKIKIE